MAIRFSDSCGDHAQTSATADLKYFGGGSATSGAVGRFGSRGYSAPNNLKAMDPGFSGNTIIFHGAFKPTSLGTITSLYSVDDSNGVTQAAIWVLTTGAIRAYRGTTTAVLGDSAAGLITVGTYYHIAAKILIHASAGTVDVWVDGVNVLSLTGQNTAVTYSGTIGAYTLAPASFAGTCDDFVVCDSSGSAPDNGYLGDVRVEVLMPQTGNGSNTGLTPSTGSDHGALVDETTPNGDTDYNGSATVGAKDTYNFPSRTATGTIIGVQSMIWAAKTDGALKQLCKVLRHGGVDYDGATKTLTTTYKYFNEMNRVNPATGLPWTDADITALQMGVKVVA